MNITVHIQLEPAEDGTPCWSADSPDLAGYVAVAQSLAELRALLDEGIPFALEDAGVPNADDFEIVEVLVVDHFEVRSRARVVRAGLPADGSLVNAAA